MKTPKYIVEHDPLSYTGYGSYIVKINNEAKTPYCIVFVALGGNQKQREREAKAKAENIASALELKEQLTGNGV